MAESPTDPKLLSSAPASDEQVKKLVDVISRSQHNYRGLIDSLDQAVFTISLDGEIRVVNRSFAEILDEDFHNLIGHRIHEFIVTPTLEEASNWLPGFLHRGVDHGRVAVRLKKIGELRYFDCWVQAVTEEGSVIAISGWARDVTSQHQAEIRFNEFFESLREGIFFTTPDGQVLDANPAMVRMLGFESKAELQSQNFSDVYADPAQRDALLRELQSRGSVQDREIVLRRKDGSHIYCLASGFAIRDSFGRIVRLQGTLVDITERREMENRLHHEQEFVRRLVACFPDLIAVFDLNGRFTYVSPRVREVLGVTPKEVIRQPNDYIVHPEDRPAVVESFRQVVTGEAQSAYIEFRARHKDGSWRNLRAGAGPLLDAEKKITGIVSSVRDVTETKVFEQQLVQREKFASMGQMLAGAAHELNNPLTAILGVSDLLRERASDDASRRQIEIVLQQARRAAAIVQNLLALAVPSGQKRGKVNVQEVLRNVADSHQKSLQQRNIRIEIVAADALPEIEADSRLLAQVFTNILLNADQAISAVRDRGTIKISLSRVESSLVVAITDDGPGIPQHMLDKIFDPFFTTKRPGGGSGLGLTICLGVIKDHGGRIDVQSVEGCGATLRIFLPAVLDGRKESSSTSANEHLSSPASGALSGRKLLVVDDEDSIREIVHDGIAARGMNVDCAESSEEAMSLLAGGNYDVVLCDFNLPGLNGEQFFEKLGARAGSPRFIFMTGDLLDSSAVASYNARGAHVLQKPFHVAALATLLTEMLQEPVKAQ